MYKLNFELKTLPWSTYLQTMYVNQTSKLVNAICYKIIVSFHIQFLIYFRLKEILVSQLTHYRITAQFNI